MNFISKVVRTEVKKTILTLLAVAVGFCLYAQSQYENGKTYKIDASLTFKCQSRGSFDGFRLSNTHDITYEYAVEKVKHLDPDVQSEIAWANREMLHPNVIQEALRHAFTQQQIESIPDKDIYMITVICDDQGTPVFTTFSLSYSDKLASFPKEQMAKFYKYLKANAIFVIKDNRQAYNFANFMFWGLNIKRGVIIYPDVY